MKPILFNTEMVRAIIEGHKTQTRRVVKAPVLYKVMPPTRIYRDGNVFQFEWRTDEVGRGFAKKPQYLPGDILYVRETWNRGYIDASDAYLNNQRWFEEHLEHDGGYLDGISCYIYRADFNRSEEYDLWTENDYGDNKPMPWHPSIHMPKEAARIFLRVTDVRVERLQDISYEECKLEGIWDNYKTPDAAYHEMLAKVAYPKAFSSLWDSTIKPEDRNRYGWDANPLVWVYTFERISKEDAL